MSHSIIFICDYQWEQDSKAWKSLLLPVVENTFQILSIPCALEVNILLTNNCTLQDLNNRFRQKDKPTNVLSFPSIEDPKTIWERKDEKIPLLLGDIALAYETIAEESLLQQKLFAHHLSHLIVHGLLHLLGYNHVEEGEAQEMETLEINILSKLNIGNPYEKDYGCS